jgi:hypothetical protein
MHLPSDGAHVGADGYGVWCRGINPSSLACRDRCQARGCDLAIAELNGIVNREVAGVVSQFASELLDAFEQKIQTETLPLRELC